LIQLNIQKLQKSFGEQEIIKDISFHCEYGDRIGIAGANGSGKSTLLHIIAGLEEADSGNIRISGHTSLGILRQEGFYQPESMTAVTESHPEVRRYLRLLKFSENSLHHPSSLSGGEHTKLDLARLLALHPDLLLLDEPTNHLDFEGVQTLIGLLYTYKGTIIMVSHDRYFLDAIVTRIIEIENGISINYSGNYSEYRKEKKRLYLEKVHRYEENKKQQKNLEYTISQVTGWSQKAHRNSTKADSSGLKMGVKEKKRAKAKKMDKQIKHHIHRLEKLKTSSEPKPIEEKTVHFEIKKSSAQGRRLLQAEQISKSFQDIHLFCNSSFTISKGEKIAVWGANGCGKTTLIQILQGQELLDAGQLWISPGISPYVVEQSFALFKGNQTVLQFLMDEAIVLTGLDRSILNNMGITKRHLSQPVRTLSYGEQMKLKLVLPILQRQDFIILDEPTNHLDLFARESLEETLSEYAGSLLVVSHDIYFLEKICDKVLVFADGHLRKLECSFAEYQESESQTR